MGNRPSNNQKHNPSLKGLHKTLVAVEAIRIVWPMSETRWDLKAFLAPFLGEGFFPFGFFEAG